MKKEHQKLNIIYRLSDKGEEKQKMPLVNNKNCLINFLKGFPEDQIEIL